MLNHKALGFPLFQLPLITVSSVPLITITDLSQSGASAHPCSRWQSSDVTCALRRDLCPQTALPKKSLRLLVQRMASAGTAGEEEQEGLLSELGWRRIKHCMRCELMARTDFFELVSRKHMAAAELTGLFRI